MRSKITFFLVALYILRRFPSLFTPSSTNHARINANKPSPFTLLPQSPFLAPSLESMHQDASCATPREDHVAGLHTLPASSAPRSSGTPKTPDISRPQDHLCLRQQKKRLESLGVSRAVLSWRGSQAAGRSLPFSVEESLQFTLRILGGLGKRNGGWTRMRRMRAATTALSHSQTHNNEQTSSTASRLLT